MNYSGYNIYTHNRATRNYGGKTTADLMQTVQADCPFCGARVKTGHYGISHHVERLGFTACPASGKSINEAQRLVAQLTADYRLPAEGGWNE